MPLNYNKWDALELSDDSDIEVHPNVDKKSMIRWKQRDIHEKREMRKVKLEHFDLEKEMNNRLLSRIDSLAKDVSESGQDFLSREISRLRVLVPDYDNKKFKPGEQPSDDHMMLSLITQVVNAIKESGGKKTADQEIGEHRERLEKRQKEIDVEKDQEIKARDSKITSDDLKVGWDSKTMISTTPSYAPVPESSKPTKTVTGKEYVVETINSPGSAPAAVEAAGEGEDDDEEAPPLTPAAKAFSNLPSLDFSKAFGFISQNPALMNPKTTDALFVEAFSLAMKNQDAKAKLCIEKGLMIQYCIQLGRDGVSLFFKRMANQDPRALNMFLEDLKATQTRIINRAHEVALEKTTEAKEQIQLVSTNPDTSITFEVPEGPPPENLVLEGEGTENLDIEQVRAFLQRRWDIYQGFGDEMREALASKSLEKVNLVLGKMEVPEAEQVVELLQEGGILSFESGGIRDMTGKDGEGDAEVKPSEVE